MMEQGRAKVRHFLLARPKLTMPLVCAILASVVFQAVTIARNNYKTWSFESMAIMIGIAFVSLLACNLIPGIDERSEAWGRGYVPSGEGALYKLLSVIPATLVRAAIMCACLSVANATYMPVHIYHETIVSPIIAIPMRFLADIPQAFLLCLIVRLLFDEMAWRDR